jgi:metallo-beta-lactamase class B
MNTDATDIHGSDQWRSVVSVFNGGKELNVVFAGSTTAPGYKLIDNPNYPKILDDYAYTFELLKSLRCDVFLAPHGSFFSLLEKMERIEKGESKNPFIDPQSYRRYVQWTEKDFIKQLDNQKNQRSSK